MNGESIQEELVKFLDKAAGCCLKPVVLVLRVFNVYVYYDMYMLCVYYDMYMLCNDVYTLYTYVC